MKFIFSSLPIDIINNILLYDEHFIMRKGEIISIIPKTDDRYKLLNYITFNNNYINFENNIYMYKYYFQNLYNNIDIKNDEIIQIHLTENKDNIEYSFWIGRKYPKSINYELGKKQIYNLENQLEYNWVYTNFEFIRFQYVRK